MKKAVVIIAKGFEEIEAITPIDILRRAGIHVTTLGVGSKSIKGSHDVVLICDSTVEEYKEIPDVIIIPGGMPGALNISLSEVSMSLINDLYNRGKLIAALCASPGVVLGATSILNGRTFTCYPGFEERVTGGTYSDNSVVIDKNVITARGPGSAMDFALIITSTLLDADAAEKIKKGIFA
jgi:protein deglycase